ncbi:sugar transporter SWEET1-like [Ptychodera flava]|uniref:sugar transporter SWEET1-like n=1 Tax=Ptychodera flava TaxID=63121 RepID=UPI00396A0107
MDQLYWVSWACLVFTVGMFAAGIPACLQIIRKRSTQDVPFLPYLATNINNVLWCYYGSLVRDSTILTVNTIGSCIQTTCIIVYIYYTNEKTKIIRLTFYAFVCVMAVLLYFNYYDLTPDRLINQLGLAASGVTVAMYSAPLAQLREVIRNKSVKSLSFPLSIATFIASSLWTLYGFLLDDMYVSLPNVPGIATSLVRFYLFWLYSSPSETLHV